MATFTINSRKHGEQVFTVPDCGGYVRLNGKQICDGGYMSGSTISITGKTAVDDIDNVLESTARKWWRQYLKNTIEF